MQTLGYLAKLICASNTDPELLALKYLAELICVVEAGCIVTWTLNYSDTRVPGQVDLCG